MIHSRRLLLGLAMLPLVACSPTSMEDCLLQAAKNPTLAGVNLAREACRMKFQPEKSAAKESALSPDEFASSWGNWYEILASNPESADFSSVAMWERKFGPPALVVNPSDCRMPDRPGSICTHYFWEDARPGRSRLYFMIRTGPEDMSRISGAIKDSRTIGD